MTTKTAQHNPLINPLQTKDKYKWQEEKQFQ